MFTLKCFLQDLLQTCGKRFSNCTASCFLLPRTIAWKDLVHLVGLFLMCRFMLLVFFATGTITCQNSSDLQPSKWMHSGHMFTPFWNASDRDMSMTVKIFVKNTGFVKRLLTLDQLYNMVRCLRGFEIEYLGVMIMVHWTCPLTQYRNWTEDYVYISSCKGLTD